MIKLITTVLSLGSSPKRRFVAWLIGMVAMLSLVFLRTATDAEFALASMAIIPVVAIAWVGGRRDGYIFSMLVSIMWAGADLIAKLHFSAEWIPYANGFTRFATYAFVSYLIASVKTLLVREKRLSTHDDLTKLLNRRAFFEIGQTELARLRRYSHPVAIVFLDLDNFKQLNDSCGHKDGDRALKSVAVALRHSLRGTDHVARLGGDEFAVLLPEISYEEAEETGCKIAQTIDSAMKKIHLFRSVLAFTGLRLPRVISPACWPWRTPLCMKSNVTASMVC
jgi:diguanylate cyclase (GGDEF)-like protein